MLFATKTTFTAGDPKGQGYGKDNRLCFSGTPQPKGETMSREYKSDVFSMLLEDKANALEVYNALNNTNYTDPGLLP